MTDVSGAVPEFSPDRDAAIDYGLTALAAALPVFGQVVADLTRGGLARRLEERQHSFNVQVAEAIEGLAGSVEGLTPETLLASDEFLASYERVSRVAAETASESKRRRLGRVLANMGPWSDLSEIQRDQLLELVLRYTDLHVFLLGFFRNPRLWLTVNSDWQEGHIYMAGISTLLGDHVFAGTPDWRNVVDPVVASLQADGVAQIPMGTTMSESGLLETRTTALGISLLTFIGEDEPHASLPG